MSKRSKLISIPALLMSVAILIFTQLVESVSGGNAIISVLYLSVGIYTLFQIGRKFKNIINPIGLYTLVWCIFIPVTSFSFPIIEIILIFVQLNVFKMFFVPSCNRVLSWNSFSYKQDRFNLSR